MKKRILIVGMVMALLFVLAVPMAVFAANDTDTSTVAGNLSGGTIDTTITGSIASWALALSSNENLTSIDMNVKCNTGTWNVQVLEVVDGNNAADGKMAEWNGTAYVVSGEVMETAIQVKSGAGSYVNLSGTAQTVQTGDATPTGGNDYDIGIQQTVNFGDLKLTSPNVYRITITFESNLPV